MNDEEILSLIDEELPPHTPYPRTDVRKTIVSNESYTRYLWGQWQKGCEPIKAIRIG